MIWLRAGVLLASFLAAAPARAGAPRLEYVYADANEGGASGGHAALRFGDQVFHFEYVSPLVQMRRDAFDALRFRYTILDNRSLSLHRLAVTPETYQHLLDAFTQRYFDQEHRLRTQRGLTADRRLLETLLARRRGQAGEVVTGSGRRLRRRGRAPRRASARGGGGEPGPGCPSRARGRGARRELRREPRGKRHRGDPEARSCPGGRGRSVSQRPHRASG